MRRVLFLFFILGIVSSAPLLAQTDEKPLISVLDFRTSGISEAEVEVFVDFLSSHIIETNRFRVIDRMQRQALLKEMEFSYEDCTDESCQLEIGRLLAANQIVVGSVGRVGERYLLTIKLIDVQTGEALKTGSEKYTTLNRLIDDCERLAQEFAKAAAPKQEELVVEQPPREEPEAEIGAKAGEDTGTPEEGRRGSAIEADAGITKWIPLDQTYVGEEDVYGFGAGVAYVYQFSNKFSLGAYAGLGVGYQTGYGFMEFVIPMFGAKLVFGNKVDSLAFNVHLGLPFGVGIYYKNFLVNVDFLAIEDDLMIGGEIGYSFYLGR